MNNISLIRVFSTTLCAMSVLMFPIFSTGRFSLPVAIWLPMQFGVISLGFVVIYRFKSTKSAWDAVVPGFVKISLPMVTVLGAVCLAYGFSRPNSDMSSTGQVTHHLNAYFKDNQCYATFNKGTPVAMQREFCHSFQSHIAMVFFGFWMVFSSVLGWFSWKFNGPDVEAEYDENFERDSQRANW